ncbi:hypothetical protein [Variovorax sp. MHTC-1]|uniref:hypothetical protein n=1 Tax=Variovorax sp. MHTC-1 TaxID=2495593 RepID=UPI000F8877CF|nr:hypothetical protein [Variovorax sp. MHTC-1]RST47225.1 hypothetical protein EJI01_28130 [Variovorax sp. MHTC-1]
MLNWMRLLLRTKPRPPRPEVGPVENHSSPPAVISMEGLADFQLVQHLDYYEGFPLLRWSEVEIWLSGLESPAAQAAAWEAMERGWLQHFREALGPQFLLRESKTAMLLSSMEAGVAAATLSYMERTLQRVASILNGLAQIPPWGKDILIVFDDAESYYRYVSHYYPDAGEFAFSSGMYIDRDSAHFVSVKTDLGAIEPVIAHEMTHACLAHLPLPLWLNEGLAVNVENRIAGGSAAQLRARALNNRHKGFWGPEVIQEFWSGESFGRTDDGSMLSYDLARLIVAQFAKDWHTFTGFVLQADAKDAGEVAAQEHLHVNLGAVVCALLEKDFSSQWAPNPPRWLGQASKDRSSQNSYG